MLTLTSCVAVIAAMPSVKALVILNTLVFGGALAAVVGTIGIKRARRLRRMRADPYASSFGDVPRDPMRAYFPRPRQ